MTNERQIPIPDVRPTPMNPLPPRRRRRLGWATAVAAARSRWADPQDEPCVLSDNTVGLIAQRRDRYGDPAPYLILPRGRQIKLATAQARGWL